VVQIKELNSYVALRKTYTNTINTKAALLDGAGGAEIGADDGPQKASSEILIGLRSCFSIRVQSLQPTLEESRI
jgi:hypothetical protein